MPGCRCSARLAVNRAPFSAQERKPSRRQRRALPTAWAHLSQSKVSHFRGVSPLLTARIRTVATKTQPNRPCLGSHRSLT
ncbi:protein of unknown function [Streptomyces murinus]